MSVPTDLSSTLDTAAGDLYEFLFGLAIRECKC